MSADEVDRSEFASLDDMTANVELQDVFWVGQSAVHKLGELKPSPDAKTTQSNQVLVRDTLQDYSVRVKTHVDAPDAEYHLDLVVLFKKLREATVPSAVSKEFTERVALFTAWPFLRQALQDQSHTIRADRVTLKLLRAGHVVLTPDAPNAQTPSESSTTPNHD